MGRLISFLACGVVVGFFAGGFQIPNMIPIMLVILWLGMGAGLRLGYAIVGAVLMPLAIAVPMWCLPGPTAVGRMYPPDDSWLAELYIVQGASEIHEQLLTAYQQKIADRDAKIKNGLEPLPDATEMGKPPTLHDANTQVLTVATDADRKVPRFDIWPLRTAWAAGLLITFAAFAVNTLTTRPFRDPRPLGQA